MGVKKLILGFVSITFLQSVTDVYAFNLHDITDDAKKHSGIYSPSLPRTDKTTTDAATATGNVIYSPEYQNKIDKEKEKLLRGVFKKYQPDSGSNYYDQTDVSKIPKDSRIYIFVSSSMPVETIRAYASDLGRLNGGTLVLRGFVGSAKKITPTMDFIASVLEKKMGCVASSNDAQELANCQFKNVDFVIDPNLYTRYGINRVPAVIYAEGVSPYILDASEGVIDNAPVKKWWGVYGDASLKYCLELLGSDSSSVSLQKIADKM